MPLIKVIEGRTATLRPQPARCGTRLYTEPGSASLTSSIENPPLLQPASGPQPAARDARIAPSVWRDAWAAIDYSVRWTMRGPCTRPGRNVELQDSSLFRMPASRDSFDGFWKSDRFLARPSTASPECRMKIACRPAAEGVLAEGNRHRSRYLLR